MGKNNKLLLAVFALLLVSVCTLYGKDAKRLSPPGKNEVIVVGKCFTVPALDQSFWSRYFVFSGKPKPNTLMPGYYYCGKKLPLTDPTVGQLEDTFFQYVKPDENGMVRLEGYTVLLSGDITGYFFLPLFIEFKVPQDAKYLYIGSYGYSFSDEYFTIKGITQKDEYDAAAAKLKERVSGDAELTRVTVKAYTPKEPLK
jgi:hypothetical protein